MPSQTTYELEFKAYSPRWKNLTHHLKKAARDRGILLDVNMIECGLRRVYHCVATGDQEALYSFKDHWCGKTNA
jgi:hypothetical protein